MDHSGVIMTSAQRETFNEHRPLLFGIAWRMLGNVADSEDVLQEALIRSVTSALLGKFRDDHRTRLEFLTFIQARGT
jgi:DNA-directed RNA polymerase specialized sigma24 family protein